MIKIKKLLIFGSGTLAELAGYYFETDSCYEIVGYVDDIDFIEKKQNVFDKPLMTLESAIKIYKTDEIEFFVAIGYRKTNTIRQMRYSQLKDSGFRLATYISTRATVMTQCIGDNCFILENNVLQPFSVVGNNVFMWSGNHLGHHSIIEDNVFITSHVVISGKCRIGKNSFLGVNCTLHDGVNIGNKSIVGAGAIVAQSCDNRTVFSPEKTISRVINRDVI